MSYNDYIEPLSGIDCDRIVKIKSNFANLLPFFVLAVYLPSSNHDDEYLDLIWSLYDSRCTESLAVMGDLSADMRSENCLRTNWAWGKIVRICALFQFVPCQLVSKLEWSFRHLLFNLWAFPFNH